MKKKGKRLIKVPISLFRPMKELNNTEHVIYVSFCSKTVDDNEYIFDIRQTASNNFYMNVFDITDDKYEEVDLNEFKDKYAEPTLFNYFDL